MGVDNVQWIRIGQLVGAHGIRGEVKLKTHDDFPDWVGRLKTVVLAKTDTLPEGFPLEPVMVERSRSQNPYKVIAKLASIVTRNDAEAAVGQYVFAEANFLSTLLNQDHAGEMLRAFEIVGMQVCMVGTTEPIGTVVDLLAAARSATPDTADYDFVEIKRAGSEETAVIPYTPHFFPKIDKATKTSPGILYVQGLEGFWE